MLLNIDPVAPEHLHDVWDWVKGSAVAPKTGLERIRAKVKPEWLPEDLFHHVRQGTANLYIVSCDGKRLGFFVTYVQTRPFSAKRELLLWCAYTILLRERGPADDVHGALMASLEFMREQARANGCDRVVQLSKRKGLRRFGFEESFTTWYLPLTST